MAAAPPDARKIALGDVTVVIVNWRREEATVDCAASVMERLPETRVVIVDNGPSAGTERLRRALPAAEVLSAGGNRGFGGGNNLVLPRLSTDFVLLLNDDAHVERAAIAELVDFLDEHPEAGIAGPVLESPTPPHDVLAAGGRNPGRHGRTHLRADERAEEIAAGRPYPVDYVPGTAALVRSDLLRRLGGFDTDYFFSGEMADLCARARAFGQESFVVPTARARHDLDSAAALRDSLYPYYTLRNRFLYVRRHPTRGIGPLVWAFRGAAGMLAALGRGRARRARALGLAIVHGLAGRFGAADEGLLD